ncbi:hypothetical protein SDA91_15065 [Legionella pneumophila serogroup 1]
MENDVSPEIKRYYQTRDRLSGELIPVLYFFWVKELITPEGEVIPLFSKYIFSQDAYPKKKPKAQIICPECWQVSEGRYDLIEFSCPHCTNQFNPQKGPIEGQYVKTKSGNRYRIKEILSASLKPPNHRLFAMMALSSNGEKIYLSVTDEDLKLFDEVKARLETEDLPLPNLAVRPGHNTNQARGYNYHYWRDFFNERQLLCLGLLLKGILKIENREIQEQFLCLFSSTLEFNNLFCSFKGEGTGAVRHMFSNHILKPERMPLENSVWGSKKGSGTFSSLFESRLIKAKRYLDEPFEVSVEIDNGGKNINTKRLASAPIYANIINDWTSLTNTNNGLLILNGDSSRLPIPDVSIDAIVTDPPYFDFIHYSELSDFFFAWLAPVLRSRYSWFERDDSSDAGEVQHENPLVFAKHLASVFSECWRVLKDDGVLVFSFHHSRPEGWAAIYEAIKNAKLSVVSAYPVHAELKGASPKSAAKHPISIDAILVCKKKGFHFEKSLNEEGIFKQVSVYANKLTHGGLNLSKADYFVIAASQMLITAASGEFSYNEIKLRLELLQASLEK